LSLGSEIIKLIDLEIIRT